MPQEVEKLNDPDDFSLLYTDLLEQSRREYDNDPSANANHNIHHISATLNPHGEPDEGEQRPTIIKTTAELRPGSDKMQNIRWDILDTEEILSLDEHLIGNRLDETASPFVNQPDLDVVRPEGNVPSYNDRYILDPEVENLFDGLQAEVDLDLMADDIMASESFPKYDLQEMTRNGVDTLKDSKKEQIYTEKELRQEAIDLLKEIGEVPADHRSALRVRPPMKVFEYVDQHLGDYVTNKQLGEAEASRLRRAISDLRDHAEIVADDRLGLQDYSVDVFDDALSHPGYQLPSRVSGPDEVINEFGIGSLEHLRLDVGSPFGL